MQHPVRTASAALSLLVASVSGAQAQTSWLLGGNSGTNAANDFLGTKDNVSLNLRVNNVRGWRLEPTGGTPNVIGGFSGNSALNSAQGAFIGGGGFLNRANTVGGNYGTIGGGAYNRVGALSGSAGSRPYATVGGGYNNWAMNDSSTVSGGANNRANGSQSVVGGGGLNKADAEGATVAGGQTNIAGGVRSFVGGGTNNQASGIVSTIGGGTTNLASGDRSTIAGGGSNKANADSATVSGGATNTASNVGATIGGGTNNIASGLRATVAGGISNKAEGDYAISSGGKGNQARGAGSSIGGGFNNNAFGGSATVPGGANNEANGGGSFAAGLNAHALHDGAFVWSDGSINTSLNAFSSTAANQFSALATGGVRFISGLDSQNAPSTGVQLAPGSGSWSMLSDRNAKSGNTAANVNAVLDALMKVSIEYWSYKTQNGVRHIGPMAQDFKSAFKVGETDTMISSVDADGVAFAAIQALKIKLDALEAQNTALRTANASLQAQNTKQAAIQTAIEARLSALESQSAK